FTAKPIAVPLEVRAEALPVVVGMPRVPWQAVRGPTDDTYRFFVTNETVMPAGNIDLTVTAKEYTNFERVTLVLPRPLVAHPPTPARSDYLVRRSLWPTRSLRLPAGETAIVARLVSGGVTPLANLKATVWPDGTPMPALPYAYSSEGGEIVYRLPDLKAVNGGVISTTASLRIDFRLPTAYTTAVVPVSIVTDTGVALGVPFAVRLGQVTTLTISLP